MSKHRDAITADVHGPYRITFANDAARTGDAGVYLASESVAGGSQNPVVAFQNDTGAEYYLANHSPTTWTAFTSPGAGEANTGSNVGTTGVGTAEVFKQKSGVDFEHRRIVQTGSATVTENGDDIEIGAPAPGEVNTGSNVGTTGVNTAGVFKQKSGVDFEHRRIVATGATTVTENGDDIEIGMIASSGEANTASNVGTTGAGTAGVFKQKLGVDLEHRRIVQTGSATVTENGDDIEIGAPAPGLGNVVEDTTPELGGDLDALNQDILNVRLPTANAMVSNAIAAGNATIDWTTGMAQTITLDQAVTLAFTDPPAAKPTKGLWLEVRQDATGGFGVTWPVSVLWAGGTPPAISGGGPNARFGVFLAWNGSDYIASGIEYS